jgi:hypothetical protein
MGLLLSPARADAPALEDQVKAAFLVKFGMFIEWPGEETNRNPLPFVIGVLGPDPFGEFFENAIKRESIRGRPVQLRRGADAAAMGDCQIVFLAATDGDRVRDWLAQLADKPVLTVSDQPNFARGAGMIGFIKEAGKMRFEINTQATECAGLRVSSKLLHVGKVIKADSPAR